MVKALLFAGGCPKAIFSAPDLGKCQRSHYDLTEGLMSSDVFHADLQQKVPPTQRIDLREIRHPRDFTPEPCGLQPRMFCSAKSNDISYQKGILNVVIFLYRWIQNKILAEKILHPSNHIPK